jgi:flavodoxin
MNSILITYNSRTGITKKYAEEIFSYLEKKKIEVILTSIQDFSPGLLKDADKLLFGSWTHGLMIFLQHPDKDWVKFARGLPELNGKKTGLFTTYKLATGSMFKKMRKVLYPKGADPVLELKSKNGALSDTDKNQLDQFMQ